MNNSDLQTLSYLQKNMDKADFEKAMNKAGLVYIQKVVYKKGKSFTQGFWIKPEDYNQEKADKQKMVETKDLHKEGKWYTNKRHALHKKIAQKILDQSEKARPGQKPVAILMGGGSASGKSTMREAIIDGKLASSGIKAGTVDSDEIKKELPEFASLIETHPEDAARLVHNESSEVGAYVIDKLISDKRHFIFDGTAKNPRKYSKLVDRLHKAGYEVHFFVADVPLEVAIERSDARAKATGRKVPHSIIEGSHRGVPNTVEAIKDKVDSYQVFDNTTDLKLIASNNFVDPELYQKFLEKGNTKYKAVANR